MRTVKIKTKTRKFFHQWMEIMTPLHRMGKPQKRVFAELLYYNYLFTIEGVSEKMREELLFAYAIRQKIATTMGTSRHRISKLIGELKAGKLISEKTLNKAYIPNIEEGTKTYTLSFEFIIGEDEETKGDNKTEGNKKVKKNSK